MEMKSDRIEVAVGSCYGAHGRCCRTAGFANFPRLHPPSFARLWFAPLITPFIYRMQIECVALLSTGAHAASLSLTLPLSLSLRSLCLSFRSIPWCRDEPPRILPARPRGKQHARRPSPITRAFAVDRRFTCSGRVKKKKITATSLDESTPDAAIVFRATFRPTGKNKCTTLDSD